VSLSSGSLTLPPVAVGVEGRASASSRIAFTTAPRLPRRPLPSFAKTGGDAPDIRGDGLLVTSFWISCFEMNGRRSGGSRCVEGVGEVLLRRLPRRQTRLRRTRVLQQLLRERRVLLA